MEPQSKSQSLHVKISLSGGLEHLCNSKYEDSGGEFKLEIPENTSLLNLHSLLSELTILKSKQSLFLTGNDVRPGIIVLINDVDSELLHDDDDQGQGYIVQNNDHIQYVGTLHGG